MSNVIIVFIKLKSHKVGFKLNVYVGVLSDCLLTKTQSDYCSKTCFFFVFSVLLLFKFIQNWLYRLRWIEIQNYCGDTECFCIMFNNDLNLTLIWATRAKNRPSYQPLIFQITLWNETNRSLSRVQIKLRRNSSTTRANFSNFLLTHGKSRTWP